MYIKIIATGMINNISAENGYLGFDAIRFYDNNNNIITGLTRENVILFDYNARTSDENVLAWFNFSLGNLVPYNSGTKKSCYVIFNLNNNFINKIDVISWGNTGGAGKLDVYYSNDNVNFNFIDSIIFTDVKQTLSLQFKSNKFLIKQGTQYYSIKPEFYGQAGGSYNALTLGGGTQPNDNDYINNGFDDIGILSNKMTIGNETFKPIDKFKDYADISMWTSN